MGEDTANASVDPTELIMNSFQFSVLFVCRWFYLHVCLFDCSDNVYRSFNYLFISNNCSFNVHANIEASSPQSMTKKKSSSGFRSAAAVLILEY